MQKKQKERSMRKEHDNISEILLNKGMKSREMTGNGKINIGFRCETRNFSGPGRFCGIRALQ